MERLPDGPLSPITDQVAKAAFHDVSRAIDAETDGMDLTEKLAELAGGPESFNALVGACDQFISRNPNVYQGRAPHPYVMGLWLGMVAGANAARHAQER